MSAETTDFPCPKGLSERSQAIWEGVVPSRGRGAGRRTMIEEALRSLDQADRARAALADEELTTVTKTTGAVHLHPLLKCEREFRGQFSKLWGQLGLNCWSSEDNAPGSPSLENILASMKPDPPADEEEDEDDLLDDDFEEEDDEIDHLGPRLPHSVKNTP